MEILNDSYARLPLGSSQEQRDPPQQSPRPQRAPLPEAPDAPSGEDATARQQAGGPKELQQSLEEVSEGGKGGSKEGRWGAP